jgi:hypothetical protein
MAQYYRHTRLLTIFKKGLFTKTLLLLLVAFLQGCNSPEGREIERQVSPDKVLDAVLVERQTNATVSTPTELFLVPSGKDWNGQAPTLRGNEFEGLRVIWKRPHFLEIHYKKGRVFSFASFWNSRDVQNFKYEVELRLVPETDSTLPN